MQGIVTRNVNRQVHDKHGLAHGTLLEGKKVDLPQPIAEDLFIAGLFAAIHEEQQPAPEKSKKSDPSSK